MGRSARTKRQRHATRTWHTRNPWTGNHETFEVCISDEALREWEENRVRLAKAGYPDRPPELDTRNHRFWNLRKPGRPIRPADLEGVVHRLGADPTAKAMGMWRTGDDHGNLKINVGRRDDGTFVLHVVVCIGQHETSAVHNYPNEAAARAMIDKTNADLISADLPPLHWTSADEMLAEIAQAA